MFNKWEGVSERRFDECLDRLGDLEVQTAWVKSDKGSVPLGVVFGIDDSLAKALGEGQHEHERQHVNGDINGHAHSHEKGHQSEVEVLSVTLSAGKTSDGFASVDTESLEKLLKEAPRDEVYRISKYSILDPNSVHYYFIHISIYQSYLTPMSPLQKLFLPRPSRSKVPIPVLCQQRCRQHYNPQDIYSTGHSVAGLAHQCAPVWMKNTNRVMVLYYE